MKNKYSFYFQKNNELFGGTVLSVCYKADDNEILKYGLTSPNILILIKTPEINDLLYKKNFNYMSELKNQIKCKKILLRIQSECLLGMYGDLHCDCESQRLDSIAKIKDEGGIFIHLPQEAQGWGLHYKLQELELQVSGRDEKGQYIGEKNRDDAQKLLLGNQNFDDCRSYEIIYKILFDLGISTKKYILISESERKINSLKKLGLDVIKYSTYKEFDVNVDNISEYLIKILNGTHTFNDEVINKIGELIINRKYNGRTLSTLINIVDKIKNDKNYNLNKNTKDKFLSFYDQILCGVEKRYIVDDSIIKLQNNFSCKVNSSIFKAIKNLYGKNVFDRISLEKLYYFESKKGNKSVRIRSSKVMDTIGKPCIFMKGQIHVEQRTFNDEKTQILQEEISLSKLRSFFENNDYDYVKRVEMITIISERQIPNINIYIKKLPNIENRIMDVYGKKDVIRKFIDNLISSLNRNVLNEVVSNSDYEDENFTDYNLRFADIEVAIQEELEIYNLLKKGDE